MCVILAWGAVTKVLQDFALYFADYATRNAKESI
jgi:hypothetical protein